MAQNSEFWTDLKDFLTYLELPVPDGASGMNRFPLLVSRHFASKIRKGDPRDPLLREVLPSVEELRAAPGFNDDPVGDGPAAKEEGILQKYEGRVLVVATKGCSLHCRFCFRRNFPYKADPGLADRLDRWLSLHTDIREVIFSGGDPVMLSAEEFEELAEVPQRHASVTTLRIHSRVPVTLPGRLAPGTPHFKTLADVAQKKHLVFVIHADHPRELDGESCAVLRNLRNAGATLLDQSVLLKDVNDDADTLAELCFKLFDQGVLPYYLHQLDHANGVAHFEVEDARALQLMKDLRDRLPGYLVPRLVRELAGESSKHPIF
ncbi:MAG: KamA family radical SAM protein [Fibrobacteraceae bacterium]